MIIKGIWCKHRSVQGKQVRWGSRKWRVKLGGVTGRGNWKCRRKWVPRWYSFRNTWKQRINNNINFIQNIQRTLLKNNSILELRFLVACFIYQQTYRLRVKVIVEYKKKSIIENFLGWFRFITHSLFQNFIIYCQANILYEWVYYDQPQNYIALYSCAHYTKGRLGAIDICHPER